MPVHPPSQRILTQRPLRPSSFVASVLRKLALPTGIAALDLPAGTGRHSELLAQLGYRVTIADVDEVVLAHTQARLRALNLRVDAVVVDASAPLPFQLDSFDLVVVTDFVDETLLRNIGTLVREDGFLIYESYAPRGGNWLQLLPPGQTEQLLKPTMKIVQVESTSAGPTGSEAEAIKVVARRLIKSHHN